MTLEQVQVLKMGDLVRYKDEESKTESIEMVICEWGKDEIKSHGTVPRVVRLKTIAIVNQSEDDEDNEAYIGEEGWITEYNTARFERIA